MTKLRNKNNLFVSSGSEGPVLLKSVSCLKKHAINLPNQWSVILSILYNINRLWHGSWFHDGCFSVDLAIDVPDFLDLSRLRATGLQASEEELPDLMPPIVLPEDTRGTETILRWYYACRARCQICLYVSIGPDYSQACVKGMCCPI